MTLGHPFYVRSNLSAENADSNSDDGEGEWRWSRELQAGDWLKTASGNWQLIVSIKLIEQTAATYNFEVAKNHNYFVGESGLLVHNQSLVQRLRNGEDVIVNSVDDARGLLKELPELRPGNANGIPGPDFRGTYRGDLIVKIKI